MQCTSKLFSSCRQISHITSYICLKFCYNTKINQIQSRISFQKLANKDTKLVIQCWLSAKSSHFKIVFPYMSGITLFDNRGMKRLIVRQNCENPPMLLLKLTTFSCLFWCPKYVTVAKWKVRGTTQNIQIISSDFLELKLLYRVQNFQGTG